MDRHEYEINQLINPKKDIVKSNSKHRDKIETLILGRNGIIRGGNTPKQETLWAIEFESGKFAFGHANENQIFVAMSGIGRQIWYADGNGVIAGSTESVDEVTGNIIDTYNEHFGTKISHLTPETELFKVGDTVNNWNAYEKIEMPSPPVPVGNYLVLDIDQGVLFNIAEEGIFVYAQSDERVYIIQDDGEVIDTAYKSAIENVGYLNALNEFLSTDYTIRDVQLIILPQLMGTNIKDTVGSYEVIEL